MISRLGQLPVNSKTLSHPFKLLNLNSVYMAINTRNVNIFIFTFNYFVLTGITMSGDHCDGTAANLS